MKITHLTSSTEIITANGIKILTDPWLDDGIYYGSWFLYPPYKQNDDVLKDIDYIYVSHIHPDHFCEKTMERLDKSIPVLIHNFDEKFLKRKIEALGFKSIELENNEPTLLKNEVYITIVAADNCNPEICGKAFGCFSFTGNSSGSNQIDSMCVITDGKHVLLNTNDCPYPIAYEALEKIKTKFQKIDFLLVGYTGASLYPYAMLGYSETEMKEAQERTRVKGLEFGAKIIKYIKPRYYMPFAGTYILGGANWELNKYSPMPELQDAVDYLSKLPEIIQGSIQSILLNSGESFDLETETQTKEYKPVDTLERWKYIENVLSAKKYTFDDAPEHSLNDFKELIPKAYKRFYEKRLKIKFETKTAILIQLPENKLLKLTCIGNSENAEIIENELHNFIEPFIYFKVEFKLLYQVFKGPRYAHWNNVEIGALLKMERKPDQYEMGIHLMLCYLHI